MLFSHIYIYIQIFKSLVSDEWSVPIWQSIVNLYTHFITGQEDDKSNILKTYSNDDFYSWKPNMRTYKMCDYTF